MSTSSNSPTFPSDMIYIGIGLAVGLVLGVFGCIFWIENEICKRENAIYESEENHG